ncbi:hypothetical protein Y1Q_0012519 [Alligator mississippiensis]|uniref:Uncharacterized protein n=1 Tax=Alligator mississippiensis TaxID=8496 RepID=A0A151M7X8_ALLMI|nr:hypothetical protein Y1Q_0012519 [Alligator mississippiensis]
MGRQTQAQLAQGQRQHVFQALESIHLWHLIHVNTVISFTKRQKKSKTYETHFQIVISTPRRCFLLLLNMVTKTGDISEPTILKKPHINLKGNINLGCPTATGSRSPGISDPEATLDPEKSSACGLSRNFVFQKPVLTTRKHVITITTGGERNVAVNTED